MSYEIRWRPGAGRDMDRLPVSIASAVVEFVYGPLSESPQRVGKPLRFELAGKYSTRRGAYRVIYQIVESCVHVEVVAVKLRSDAYR